MHEWDTVEKERLEGIRRQMRRKPAIPESAEFEILASAPILWSGWGCDRTAVLYRILPDGKPELHVLGGVEVTADALLSVLEERIDVYERAARQTRDFIGKAKTELALSILARAPDVPPKPGDEVS